MTRNDAPPHVLAWIKTGISAMVPLKVELIGFKASIHFEIKITGSSPFISTGKFSFLTPPLFDISIMPLVPMNIAQVFEVRNDVFLILRKKKIFIFITFIFKNKVSYYKRLHTHCS